MPSKKIIREATRYKNQHTKTNANNKTAKKEISAIHKSHKNKIPINRLKELKTSVMKITTLMKETEEDAK